MEKWLIGFAAYFILSMLNMNKKQKMKEKHSIESSMVSMTECIHMGKLIVTDWSVYISSEMRAKLYYPLTHDIVHMLSTAQEKAQLQRHSYRCVNVERDDNNITGQVEINIDYVNPALALDLHYHKVVLTICWSYENGTGWYVSSVEHS